MFGLSRLALQLIASGVISLGLVTSCVVRDRSIENRGAAKQSAKIEKANDHAAKLGSGAARKSGDDRVRGQLDPTTRND